MTNAMYKSKLIDRMLLVICALAVGGALLWFIMFLSSFGILDGWIRFIGSAGVYVLVAIYVAYQDGAHRHRKMIYMLYYGGTAILIVLLAAIPFVTGVLPLPNNLFPYQVAQLLLAPIPILMGEHLAGRSNKIKSHRRLYDP